MTGYTYRILTRNDTIPNWNLTGTTILEKGEFAIAFSGTTFYGLKVGNGIDTWNDLNYLYTGITDLSDYYTKSESNNNFLSGNTTITDLSGYTQTYIDDTFTGFTGNINISGQTGEVVLNVSNGLITSTGNTW
jgi:hypothetical protein